MCRSILQKPHSDKSTANQQNPRSPSVAVCLEAEISSGNANLERRVLVEDSWIEDADEPIQNEQHELLLPIRHHACASQWRAVLGVVILAVQIATWKRLPSENDLGQGTQNRAQGVHGTSRPTVPKAMQPQKEPTKLPSDDIRRTLKDIDRQRAEERAQRRWQVLALAEVAPGEVCHTLEGLEHQHTQGRVRQRPSNNGLVPRPTTPEQAHRSPQTSSLKRPRVGDDLFNLPPTRPVRRSKRPRPSDEVVEFQREPIEPILQYHKTCFYDGKEALASRSWCKEDPLLVQVKPSKSFYQAFTDERPLPISHCVFCYRKESPGELVTIQWKNQLTPSLMQATRILQLREKCLLRDGDAGVHVCRECRAGPQNGRLPKVCSVNNTHIGYEHRYPQELDALSPVEGLIAFRASFGFTNFTVDNKAPPGLSCRKHVTGYIVVFPNKMGDLVATVLCHPLLPAVENIHVSWRGSSKPGPTGAGNLPQVRKTIVKDALLWLQRNNALYEHIVINDADTDSWRYEDSSNVPILIPQMMWREEPSIAEKVQTEHFVPNTHKWLPENQFTSIEELLASDQVHSNEDHYRFGGTASTGQFHHPHEDPDTSVLGQDQNQDNEDVVHETSCSGMFLDEPTAFSEAYKLSFLVNAMQTNRGESDGDYQPCSISDQTMGEQPFIRVERGTNFADNLHEDISSDFPKTVPVGKGSKRNTQAGASPTTCLRACP